MSPLPLLCMSSAFHLEPATRRFATFWAALVLKAMTPLAKWLLSQAVKKRVWHWRWSPGKSPTCCCWMSPPTTWIWKCAKRLPRRWPVFEGTVILVSHDRHLLRATVDEFWCVADNRVEPFDGDLEDYRAWLKARLEDKRRDSRSEKNERQNQQPSGDSRDGARQPVRPLPSCVKSCVR